MAIMDSLQVFKQPKPFIKWAGGKGQLLNQLDNYLPKRLFNEDFTYIEPFVGGGAMLFHMLRTFSHIKRVIVNDVNENLVKAYKTIKESPNALIEKLRIMESEFLTCSDEGRKTMYLEARELFNQHNSDDIQNTAYFMFLNKTCFNGLYRVNAKGEFNVPFGKYRNPQICNASTILADSKALNSRNIIITCDDYSGTAEYINKGSLTFFYMDPPL